MYMYIYIYIFLFLFYVESILILYYHVESYYVQYCPIYHLPLCYNLLTNELIPFLASDDKLSIDQSNLSTAPPPYSVSDSSSNVDLKQVNERLQELAIDKQS